MLRMIVDFHTHVVPPGIKERRAEYVGRDACFSLLYAEPKAKLATAEEVIASMDEHGIDKSVILNLGWVSHELCVETNDYILEAIARYPERLIGFCVIQPLAGDKALKELERCARNGVKGIGEMRPDVQDFDLKDSSVMRPVIETAVKHNLIFLTHASEPVGHQYFGKGNITPEAIYPFILNFPDLKVVCAHWGGGLPFYALMPEVAEALGNVYFDTAATPFLYKPQIFKQVADIAGSDKILFGSDYPLLSPKRIIDQLESTGLSQEDKAKILGGNAQRLLSIP
ncbi:MAG: amidohydrolase family protein [Chloroflexi bacterium]|nr:amidohydrolase family protein [Chloroflexota bacterium]